MQSHSLARFVDTNKEKCLKTAHLTRNARGPVILHMLNESFLLVIITSQSQKKIYPYKNT